MHEDPTVESFYKSQGEELQLEWVVGKGNNKRIFTKEQKDAKTGAVGYFNLIHSSQAQVVGKTEINYLQSLDEKAKQRAYAKLFSKETVIVVIADDHALIPDMTAFAEKNKVALFKSKLPGEHLINSLRYYLSQLLADKVNMHGVFMEVLSIGVLLTGASNIGKSELALELITRGHRLIADDAPLFARIAPDIVMGTAPKIILDFLEVRGLGVLNIRQMYGDSAIKTSKYLKLILDLQPADRHDVESKRLMPSEETRDVLGLKIPATIIPVAPGRNLAVMVEAAVRSHLLKRSDYYAYADIAARQLSSMSES